MSNETKDVLIKALNTFWQGALAFIVLAADPIIKSIGNGDWNGVAALAYAVLLGAIAAGLSAVKTLLIAKYKD